MKVLSDFVAPEEQEVYSIDECFLDLTSYVEKYDLTDYAQMIRHRIFAWLGLPVCIGLGRTKTEAKMANHIAKKNAHFNGVCNLVAMDYCSAESLYEAIEVSEIWGVGRKHSKKLNLPFASLLPVRMDKPLVLTARLEMLRERDY